MLDAFDMLIIGIVKKVIVALPYGKVCFYGFPLGIYAYMLFALYVVGEIYLIVKKVNV